MQRTTLECSNFVDDARTKKMNFTNYFQLAPKGWPAGAGQQWCHDLNHISYVLNYNISLDFHLLDTLRFYTSPI